MGYFKFKSCSIASAGAFFLFRSFGEDPSDLSSILAVYDLPALDFLIVVCCFFSVAGLGFATCSFTAFDLCCLVV